MATGTPCSGSTSNYLHSGLMHLIGNMAVLWGIGIIVEGKIVDWGMPPDDIFIRSLESHLDWPVLGTRDFLVQTSEQDQEFASRLQSWMAEEMKPQSQLGTTPGSKPLAAGKKESGPVNTAIATRPSQK